MERSIKVKVIKGTIGAPGQSWPRKSSAAFTATFEEVPNRGVRVTGLGGTVALWMSGSRKYLPPTNGGERYNLHAGDPTRYITIEVQTADVIRREVPRCKHGTRPDVPCGLCESED